MADSTWPSFLIVLMVFGMITTIVVVPIVTPKFGDNMPMAPQMFEEGGADYSFQQRICRPCINDWPLATDERVISNSVFKQVQDLPDPELTALVPFWGQFMDHDLVRSFEDRAQGVFNVTMVPGDGKIFLTRVAYRNASGNATGPCRESATEITPMIDAGTVYGDHSNPNLGLRDGASCKLRTSAGNLLPLNPVKPKEFLAGDTRNTEHSILASLHTLWMREHNRVCDELPRGWTEEERFWKARQIVIAKIQHITYAEWLPLFLGSQYALLDTVEQRGESTRVAMEFAVAAYRIGHSMIPDPVGPFQLPTLFFNRHLLIDNGVEPFLEAAIDTPAQQADHFVVSGLRDVLFGNEDLTVRNLFRSRELGLSTYAQVCACYGLEPLVLPVTTEEFYVGMVFEPHPPGCPLPRVVAHVVAEQFARARDNDPNFYTKIADKIGPYFYAQVQQTTLARIIERNTGLKNVKSRVFVR